MNKTHQSGEECHILETTLIRIVTIYFADWAEEVRSAETVVMVTG